MSKVIHVTCTQKDRQVMLATPSYDGKVSQVYTASLLQSIPMLRDAGIGVTYCLLGGNCHVDDARNALVREFLKTGCTDLVFLDADVGWPAENLVNLLSFDRDLVAGVYPKKGIEPEYPVHVLPGTTLQAEHDGLVAVVAAPTGFMRIRRNVIETLLKTHGQRQYMGQDWKVGDTPYTILFERTYEDGSRWSGDYAFCRKWASTGGKIHVDPRMYFLHEGSHEFGGCLGEFWKEKHGVTERIKEDKFAEAVEAVAAGTHTSGHLIDLVNGWGNEWSGRPELLEACIELGRNAEGPILECGSGLTTLVLGLVSRHPVIALENSPVWGSYTEKKLAQFGVKVDLRCAPLKSFEHFDWYDAGELPNIALVVCDGPTRKTRGGRNGLTSVMEKLQHATFVLDDPAQDTMEALKGAFAFWTFGELDFQILGTSKPIAISKVVAHA